MRQPTCSKSADSSRCPACQGVLPASEPRVAIANVQQAVLLPPRYAASQSMLGAVQASQAVPRHAPIYGDQSSAPRASFLQALDSVRPASEVTHCKGPRAAAEPQKGVPVRTQAESRFNHVAVFSFDMSAFEVSNNAPIANDDDDVAEDHAPPRPCPGAFGEHAERQITVDGDAPESHQLLAGSQQRYCDACKVAVSGDLNWQQHIEGEKHLRLMNHVAGFAMLRGSEQHNCKVCNVLVSGNDNWRIHIEGEKHLRKQLAAAVSAPCPSHGVILSQALNLIRQSPPGAQYVLRLMLYRDQWRSQCRAARHGRRAHAENGPTSSPLRRLQ